MLNPISTILGTCKFNRICVIVSIFKFYNYQTLCKTCYVGNYTYKRFETGQVKETLEDNPTKSRFKIPRTYCAVQFLQI